MNAPSRLPRLLTVAETAEALGLSIKTIRRRIDAREIPVHRPGRAVRIAEADLLAYLAGTKQ